MCIKEYGFLPTMMPENAAGTPARITAVSHDRFEIVCAYGMGYASLKASEYYAGNEVFPTTGDFVMLEWQANGDSRIIKTLHRKTCFLRRDPSSSGHGEQAIAANFDYVFIMQSLDHDFNPRRLERYLTLAWQSGAIPAVLLTKADCLEDFATQMRIAERLATGVAVIAISAKTGYGIEHLRDYLKPGKTIVCLGSSGVGKSSLINALAGEALMQTNDIREKDGRGRHTTTRRQLMRLTNGVIVIDTPGMREIGMWEANGGMEQSFADVKQYLGQCKFHNCRHQSEPGCAIKKAIKNGELSQQRWESYLRLEAEAGYGEDKAGYLRQKEKFFKHIAMSQRKTKTVDYRNEPCTESFVCKACGSPVAPEHAGSRHRNHCPQCLVSMHVDHQPGDRASLCKGIMDPIGVWVRKNDEWALIHRCRSCGALHSNRIAADDNHMLLLSIAMKPLASPPFPLWQVDA